MKALPGAALVDVACGTPLSVQEGIVRPSVVGNT